MWLNLYKFYKYLFCYADYVEKQEWLSYIYFQPTTLDCSCVSRTVAVNFT